MSKSYIQKITPFIDNMRVEQDSEEPVVSLTPFVENDYVYEGDKIKFNLDLSTSYINNFLDNLDYNMENNSLRILIDPEEGDDILSAMDLTAMGLGFDGKLIMGDADRMQIYYSTNEITDPGAGMTIQAGWQPIVLENDGEIPIPTYSRKVLLEDVYEGEGWNGIIAGLLETGIRNEE